MAEDGVVEDGTANRRLCLVTGEHKCGWDYLFPAQADVAGIRSQEGAEWL